MAERSTNRPTEPGAEFEFDFGLEDEDLAAKPKPTPSVEERAEGGEQVLRRRAKPKAPAVDRAPLQLDEVPGEPTAGRVAHRPEQAPIRDDESVVVRRKRAQASPGAGGSAPGAQRPLVRPGAGGANVRRSAPGAEAQKPQQENRAPLPEQAPAQKQAAPRQQAAPQSPGLRSSEAKLGDPILKFEDDDMGGTLAKAPAATQSSPVIMEDPFHGGGGDHREVAQRDYSGSSRDSATRNKMITAGAMAAAAAGVAAVLFGSMGRGDEDGQGGGGSASRAGSPGSSEQREPARGADLMPPRPGETDGEIKVRIAASLARFFSSERPEDLLAVVRDPERVKPLIEDYYSREPYSLPRFAGIKSAEEGMVKLKPIWEVFVNLEDFGTKAMWVQDSERGFLVDWETFVRYNPMDWEDYIEQRPVAPHSFRVYARLDHNPGYAFPEVDSWLCVELSVPGSGEILYGYIERGSEVADWMAEVLENNRDWQCIVELQFPADGKGGDNQVHLRRLLAEGWIWVD